MVHGLREVERTSQQQLDRMIRLEDQNRQLKQKIHNLKRLKGDDLVYGDAQNTPKGQKPPLKSNLNIYSNNEEDSAELERLSKVAKKFQSKSHKDEKLLQMQKKLFDKHLHAQNKVIKQHEQSLKEKVKELRMQGLKIKELMNAGTDFHRNKIIKKDYQLLQSLS